MKAMEVRGLVRRYGGRAAVGGLDLDVETGDLYGFLGPNGAGKTTAIRCILGLIRRDAGEVTLLGEKDPVRQRRAVGAMVETPRFHEWLSGKENLKVALAYSGAEDQGSVEEALRRVGLSERQDEAVKGYSLGMKQRLGIARALVGRPRLLVLDEPTNGLDPRGMVEVRELLKELVRRDKITVFVSSHLLSEVELMCNRVGIIDKGLLTAQGGVEELLAGSRPNPRVEIGFGSAPENRRLAVELLASVPEVKIVGDGDGGRMIVELSGIDAAALNRLLVLGNVPVSSLNPLVGTLEEVYLSATSQEAGVA